MFNSNLGDYRSGNPGEIITFGTYPQTADGADKTPIQWRVLQNSNEGLFLLSEHILDCKRYHAEFVDVAWRDCDLRKWLSDEFYNAAFDNAEKSLIQTTHCIDNGEGNPDTEDMVFLLSAAEVTSLTSKDISKVARRAIGTEFAKVKKADGCCLYVYDKSIKDDYLNRNGTMHGCSWWWTRTQPSDASRTTFVGTRASLRSYGRVNLKYYGVRPAIKLRKD